MSYVGEPYSNDLCVIYSRAGDGVGGRLTQWSEAFVRELQDELRMFPDLTRDLKLFVDQHRGSEGGDPTGELPDGLRHQIGGSALLVALLSDDFLLSPWCRDQVAWWANAQRDYGLAVEGRVALVRVAPTTNDLPAPFVDERGYPLVGFPFYEIGDSSLAVRPFGWPEPGRNTGGEFRKALLRLVGLLALRLREIRAWAGEDRRDVGKSASHRGQRRASVLRSTGARTLAPGADATKAAAIAERVKRKRAAGTFDVFLCHNTKDKEAVLQIGEKLLSRGLVPWVDVWELRPGFPWQMRLEEQIAKIQTAAVFMGRDGVGPWQRQEIEVFLREFIRRQCPVIPVMLEGTVGEPALPLFLRGMTWVDFRIANPDPLEQLIWGITGERPQFA